MTDRLLAPPAPVRTTAVGGARRWPERAGVALVTLLGALHVWAVWSTYHVGSFDDDGQYVALARALASGQGFVDTSLPGDPVEVNRPPGPALLFAPFAALSPDTTWQFQLLCAAAFLACFPLMWHWMRLRGLGAAPGLAVLALFALNPLAATYGVMVMVEMPFLVALLLMLIALHHWDRQDRAVTWWGLLAVALLAWLLALKSAALAFLPGVVGYLLLRALWPASGRASGPASWRARLGKATLAAAAGLLVLVPVAVVRVLHGASPLGERDAGYFEQYSQHPLLHYLEVLPRHVYEFVVFAVPNSTLPVAHLSHWPAPLPDLLYGLRFVVTALVVVGFVAWHRRRGFDATLVIAVIYLAQSLSYPFINERRVILLLPIVLLWLVVGVVTVGEGVAKLWSIAKVWSAARLPKKAAGPRGGPASDRGRLAGSLTGSLTGPLAGPVSLALCAAVSVPVLGAQFDRNYRLPSGYETSQPEGSSYVRALRAVTEPDEDISSSYRWTIAAFSGRDTLHAVQFAGCAWPSAYERYAPRKLGMLRQHTYGAVVLGTFNWPWSFDDACTLDLLQRNPAWAVRIHRQPRDKAVVFQLVGPGTANPGLSDVTLGRTAQAGGATLSEEPERPYVKEERASTYRILRPTGGDQAILAVPFGRTVPVTQVSLGAAGQRVGAAESIAIELRAADGTWSRVWEVRGADVAPREPGPDVVVRRFDTPRTATAVRVAFRGDGPFEVHDLHVLAQTGHRGEPALR